MPVTSNELNAVIRDETGQSHNRELRDQSLIPAVVYGQEIESTNLKVPESEILPLLRQGALNNAVIDLQVEAEDEPRKVLIKDVQKHPVNDQLTHVDFHQVRPEDSVQIQAPVELVGESPGVEFENGIIDQPIRELHLECQVKDIPDHVEASIDELDIGDTVFVSDIEVPSGVKILDHPERTVVSIQPPKEFDLEPSVEEEEELIEETVEEAMEEAAEEGELEEEAVEGEEAEEGEGAEAEAEGEAPGEPE